MAHILLDLKIYKIKLLYIQYIHGPDTELRREKQRERNRDGEREREKQSWRNRERETERDKESWRVQYGHFSIETSNKLQFAPKAHEVKEFY